MAQTWFRNGRHMNIGEIRALNAKQKELKNPKKTVCECDENSACPNCPKNDVKKSASLKALVDAYEAKFGKKPVGKYAKNKEWLEKKLNY